ncbi:MAG: tetratricopeptide repeat protein [Pirellulales bacterium]|nr:tetratricopeptide repeat protein [Pirellulales bacterium]
MAPDDTDNGGLDPAKRKRLQQCFQHANKMAAQDNFDYATELYTECVLGDLNNTAYWQGFLGNLRKKYNNNKKGAKFASLRTGGDRAGLKKCQLQKHWSDVIQHGVEILKFNPWDGSALAAMAAAGEELDLDETPLLFLKTALEAAPKDVELNRAAAKALRLRKQFDQAIFCWNQVLKAKPGDQEANKTIAELAVEKTIDHGGYEGAKSSLDVAADKKSLGQVREEEDSSPEAKYERAIRKDPTDVEAYRSLAAFYLGNEDYAKAEEVFARACKAIPDDSDLVHQRRDIQIRHLRSQMSAADKEYQATKSDEAKKKRHDLKRQYDLLNLEMAQDQCERNPNSLMSQFQLGEAYLTVGQFNEAIQWYQKARNNPQRKGLCFLRLGLCFEKIKQDRLASTNYDSAVAEISDTDGEHKKDALYRSGRLALKTGDLDKADEHLTALAGMDFGYRDVAALLDKLNELRNNG